MEYQDKIAKIEAKIAKLTKQRNELRAEAIEQGYAHYVTTYRTLAPNLQWWKENRFLFSDEFADFVDALIRDGEAAG